MSDISWDANSDGVCGYKDRDWDLHPQFSSHQEYTGKIYPRADWRELIELQKKNRTSPMDIHQGNEVPILNQGRYGYCWMYGTVGCILNRFAYFGLFVNPKTPFQNVRPSGRILLGRNFFFLGTSS